MMRVLKGVIRVRGLMAVMLSGLLVLGAPSSVWTQTGNVSLKFKEANIRTVLGLIAAKAGMNIISGPEVNATVTVSMENVPWEQALDSILKTYRFGYERDGNIIRVMSENNLAKETFKTRIFETNYIRAEEVSSAVSQMLSEDGKVSVSQSSNSVIVTDFPTILSKVEKVIANLDELQKQKDEERERKLKADMAAAKADEADMNVTLSYEGVDIRTVLNDIAHKTKINIIVTREVGGTVDLNMVDVPWWEAMESLFRAYGLGYEPEQTSLTELSPGDIISVMPLQELVNKKQLERSLDSVQDLVTRVFELKYVDANVMKAAILEASGGGSSDEDSEESESSSSGGNLLSGRGSVIVMSKTITPGWEFNTSEIESARARIESDAITTPSRYLAVIDIPSVVEKVEAFIEAMDIQPEQILIESKIVEVSVDDDSSFGVEWRSLGQSATSDRAVSTATTAAGTSLANRAFPIGDNNDEISTHTNFSAVPDFENTGGAQGIQLLWQRLSDAQVEMLLHAADNDEDTNVLSSPRILTTDSREAGIIVGTKFPIVKIVVTDSGTTETVEYIQIGIQLYVIPKVIPGDRLNLIVHPVVSSFNSFVGNNPVIDTREADTAITTKSGETVVIGGLLNDKTISRENKVPLLGDIPLLGMLFKSTFEDVEKRELLVFLKGTIMDESSNTPTVGTLDMNSHADLQLSGFEREGAVKRSRMKGYDKMKKERNREERREQRKLWLEEKKKKRALYRERKQ